MYQTNYILEMHILIILFCLIVKTGAVLEKTATPPMGYSTWNTYGMMVNESIVLQIAQAMVRLDLPKLGYQYLIVDEPCFIGRNSNGVLLADPVRFPNGMFMLASYLHSLGLKFGLYTDAGPTTCGGCIGSYGYEYLDMLTFAIWGVDYVKVDYCSSTDTYTASTYLKFRDAIMSTNRSMVLSIISWGLDSPWLWGRNVGNSWRIAFDIRPEWQSILSILDQSVGLEKYSGPGGWNDLDMLEVGNTPLTFGESQSHFVLWSILNSPLLLGNDLDQMSSEITSLIKNREIIALNQDILGIQAKMIVSDVWAKFLSDGSLVIAFLNRGSEWLNVTIYWNQCYVLDPIRQQRYGQQYSAGIYSKILASHNIIVLRFWCQDFHFILDNIYPVSNNSLGPFNPPLISAATYISPIIVFLPFLLF